jgi:hypothetical protein
MAEPSLRAEDGAEFFGTIERLDGGHLFRASCHVQRSIAGGVETEGREFRMCGTADAARKWIAERATKRGFTAYRFE